MEKKEEWKIGSDYEADWALRKISEKEAELKRLKDLAEQEIEEINQQIEKYQKSFDSETGFLKSKLEEYFNTVEHKKTKTTESYQLLHGKLVRKEGGQAFERDDEALIDYLKGNGGDYIVTKQTVDWAGLKKNLMFGDGVAFDKFTGEKIPGIKVTKKPDEFMVKIDGTD